MLNEKLIVRFSRWYFIPICCAQVTWFWGFS